MFELNRAAGIVNQGNDARLRQVMQRAYRGEKLTIGFLGGSITQGSLASTPELCYAYRVFSWWEKTFPMADFTYVNAGIGATDSQYGAARVQQELLIREPDVVFIEFSVNDESTEHFLETYEGLVRRVLSWEPTPAVVLIHNVCYNNGASAQLMHARVGRHYDLPSVSMQSTIYAELLAGRIQNREITPDDLHPNDAGHELVASVITYYLETVRDAAKKDSKAGTGSVEQNAKTNAPSEEAAEKMKAVLPAPLTANAYENSRRYDSTSAALFCEVQQGFAADTRPKEGITDNFKTGWEASAPNARIVFALEGSGVSVQYRRSVRQPAPVAEVIVDNDPATRKILDANFDETWGDKLELQTITEHMQKGVHRVEIRLIETHEEDVVPFYLNAVIMAD